MNLSPVVSPAEWQAAHEAKRRRQPMVQVDKDYVFHGPGGEAHLADVFDGRRQLILYHFMFAPDVDGWPEAGCPGYGIK